MTSQPDSPDFTADFEIIQATTFQRSLQWLNPDGSVVSLTDYTAEWQARPAVGSPAVIDEEPVINASHEVILALTSAETAAIPPGDYLYGVRLTYEGGEPKYMLVSGYVRVNVGVVA